MWDYYCNMIVARFFVSWSICYNQTIILLVSEKPKSGQMYTFKYQCLM